MEELAAIAFSGKLTLNDWLPGFGTSTRSAEVLGRCGDAPIAGASVRGSGLLDALLVGLAGWGEYAGLELAGGETLRAVGPNPPLSSEFASGLADGLDSAVRAESESAERGLAKYSGPRVRSWDSFSEGAVPSSLFVPAESSEVDAGGVWARELDSSG